MRRSTSRPRMGALLIACPAIQGGSRMARIPDMTTALADVLTALDAWACFRCAGTGTVDVPDAMLSEILSRTVYAETPCPACTGSRLAPEAAVLREALTAPCPYRGLDDESPAMPDDLCPCKGTGRVPRYGAHLRDSEVCPPLSAAVAQLGWDVTTRCHGAGFSACIDVNGEAVVSAGWTAGHAILLALGQALRQGMRAGR